MASDFVRCSDCNRSRLNELHSSTNYIATVISWNQLRLGCFNFFSFPVHIPFRILDPYQCTREDNRSRLLFTLGYVAHNIFEFAVQCLLPSLSHTYKVSFAWRFLKVTTLTACPGSAIFQRLRMPPAVLEWMYDDQLGFDCVGVGRAI